MLALSMMVAVLAAPASTDRAYEGVLSAPTAENEPPVQVGSDVDEPAEPQSPPPPSKPKPPAKPPQVEAHSGAKQPNLRLPGYRSPKGVQFQPWVRTTVFTEWYRQNYNPQPSDDGFVSLVGRLNLGGDTRFRKATLGTQLRLDGQKIWFPSGQNCSQGGVCAPVEDDIRLERTTLRLDTKYITAWGGDFNLQQGRGLGLSVRKIDEIGVDATVKGGRLDLRTKPVRATAFAGFANRQNSDFATRQLLADPGYPAQSYTFAQDARDGACSADGALDPDIGNPIWTVCSDLLAGGRVEGTLPGRVDVGAHYTYLDFGDELVARTDTVIIDEHLHQVGADIGRARIAGVWDTFAGATAVVRNPNLRNTQFESERYDGYGVYAANTFFIDSTTVLVEAKHYSDYLMALTQNSLMQYTENPTLEREDQQVPGNLNATGGRVRVDHTWRSIGLTLFGNTLNYAFAENLDQDQFSSGDGRFASHNYGGVIYRRPKSDLVVQASGGYRYEMFLDTDRLGGQLRRRFPHAEFYLSIPAGKTGGLTHAINLAGEGRWENIRFGASEDFYRGLFVVGYSLSPWFSISYLQGIDTELAAPDGEPSLTDEACSNAAGSTCRPHLWPGVQARITLWNASFLRIFAGRQAGGRVCVNGSCRTLPDFEGIRSELVLSF